MPKNMVFVRECQQETDVRYWHADALKAEISFLREYVSLAGIKIEIYDFA